jgi:tetratricopeptide (TPR) repeat protein
MPEADLIGAFPALIEAREALDDGRQELAASLVIGHLRKHPGEPRGLAQLGRIAIKTGALQQGENFLRQAIARGLNDLSINQDLATCLHQQERILESLELWQAILAKKPNDPRTLGAIANIYDKLDRGDEARKIWERLLEDNASKPPYWIGYGLNLRAAGRTEEAINAFRRALANEPERGEAWWALASISGYTLTDGDVAQMEKGLETASDILNLSPLHFALGRAYHARKDYERAFEHYHEANRHWAEAIKYNPQELSDEISEVSERFGPQYFDRLVTAGDPSPAPIFILSLPRSGSTLIEQMLGSHPEIEALGELPYISTLLRAAMERATQRGRITVPQLIGTLSPEERTAIGSDYVRRASVHRRTGKAHFVDKLPHNWNNVLFIKHILPNAKFIDIRRNPVACSFANFTHSFTRAHSSSFVLTDIGRAYVDYVRLMNHLDQASPGLVHHIQYEKLVEEPEKILRPAFAYLGLPWDDAVLEFHKTDRNIRTPSAEQVRRPLNREGMGTWIPYRQWLGPLFEALGPLADEELAEADRA